MPPDHRYCLTCRRPLRAHSERQTCPACQCLNYSTSGHRKIKRALVMLLIAITLALVLEGLWAAGVITPHAWLLSFRRHGTSQLHRQALQMKQVV